MDANFVNTVVEALAVPKEFGRGEKAVLMAPRGWGRVEPRNRTFDSPIRLRSLASLAAYLGQNRDGLDLGKVMVVVDGPTNARVLTGYRESENGDTIRVVHSHAACDDMIGDQLGKWVDYEKFVIWLRTAFIQDQQMTDLLTLLGAISSSNVSESVDNGWHGHEPGAVRSHARHCGGGTGGELDGQHNQRRRHSHELCAQ
jgi:hypothetical protein